MALSVPACTVGDAFASVRLAFDSTRLDFGNVILSSAHDLAIEVWDTASVAIEIDQFSLAGQDPGDFKVLSPGAPTVLSPGATPTKIIVQFSPLAFGNCSGLLLIETSDGNVSIPLTGNAIGGGNLVWADSSIDFGNLAPGGERDTVIELYSVGTDTAVISGIDFAAPDSSFEAQFVTGTPPPIELPPGDSIAVKISFRGLPLEGEKDAVLFAESSGLSIPSCDLIGNIELGSFATLPPFGIDFGVMYAGQMLDTAIQLINTGDVDLVFEELSLSPSGDDFTILNAPPVPFTLPAGDTLWVTIQANPGIATSHLAYLDMVSQQASPNFESDSMTVSVTRPSISAPSVQALSYYCAIIAVISDTVPISNTGPERVVITSVTSNDPSVVLRPDVSFPDTIAAGSTMPVVIHFIPSSVAADTFVLRMMGGAYAMLTDTVALQPLATTATATIVAASITGTAPQQVEARTATKLDAFDLDTIIVHISVQDSNVATIDSSTIALSAGLANATISSITADPGGYTVTITSTAPISAAAGSPLVTMDLDRFVSNSDSTGIIAAIETPERAGCLAWTADTTMVTGPDVCGSTILTDVLSDRPFLSAKLRQNPISDENVELSVIANASGSARFELLSALGEILTQGYLQLSSGLNECSLPMSGIRSGVYTVRLISESGFAVTLRLVIID